MYYYIEFNNIPTKLQNYSSEQKIKILETFPVRASNIITNEQLLWVKKTFELSMRGVYFPLKFLQLFFLLCMYKCKA
jgi:hypothetical protein